MIVNPVRQRLAQLAAKAQGWRRLWQWLGYALTTGAVGYMVITLLRSGQQIQIRNWKAYLPAVSLTLLFHLVSFLLQLFVWIRLIGSHHSVGWRDVGIYSRMVLLRYLPGGFWQWIGRTAEYKATTAIPGRLVALANLYEWGMLILVAGGVYLFAGIDAEQIRWSQAGLGILVIIAAVGLAFSWQPKRRPLGLRFFEGCLWIVFNIIAWLLGGAIVYLLTRASGGSTLGRLEAVRIWTLTGGIGFISSLFAGLLVREIALTWLLQPYLPMAASLLVALLLRVLFTIADTLWGGVGWGVSHLALSGNRLLKARTVRAVEPD